MTTPEWTQNQSPGAGLLQRQCACGTHTVAGGECDTCRRKREASSLQRTAAPPTNQTSQQEQYSDPAEAEADSNIFPSTGLEYDFSQTPAHTQSHPVMRMPESKVQQEDTQEQPKQDEEAETANPALSLQDPHTSDDDQSLEAGSPSVGQSRFWPDFSIQSIHTHNQTIQMREGDGSSSTASCTISSSMFTVSGAAPQSSGNVTAHRSTASGTMTLRAPLISYNADVQLNSSFCPGSSDIVEVGPTQTLNSGNRIGIYREAGLATGDIVAQKHQNVSNVRDAQWTTNSRGEIVASFPEPWYGRPHRVSASFPQTTVGFRDQPAFELPLRIGNGFLTETQGADSFTVGLSAKKGSQLLHLSSHDWSVPWSMDLISTNQGLPISVSPASAGPSVTTGPIAMTASHEWIFFPTVEAAEAVSVRMLIENLIPNDLYDTSRVSYLNIIEALRNKDPKFQFTIAVNETADFWGDDEVSVSVTGRLTARRGPFSLGEGDSQSFEVSLQEVFHDPILIHGSSKLLILARDQGQGHAFGTIEWAYPFHDQSSPANFSGEEGEYTLTGTLV